MVISMVLSEKYSEATLSNLFLQEVWTGSSQFLSAEHLGWLLSGRAWWLHPAEKVHESSWKFMKYDEKMPQ